MQEDFLSSDFQSRKKCRTQNVFMSPVVGEKANILIVFVKILPEKLLAPGYFLSAAFPSSGGRKSHLAALQHKYPPFDTEKCFLSFKDSAAGEPPAAAAEHGTQPDAGQKASNTSVSTRPNELPDPEGRAQITLIASEGYLYLLYGEFLPNIPEI